MLIDYHSLALKTSVVRVLYKYQPLRTESKLRQYFRSILFRKAEFHNPFALLKLRYCQLRGYTTCCCSLPVT